MLDAPHLVRQLEPEALYKIIERCGLEDCADLIALATPEQLAHVFDLDLWRGSQPGLDERLDAGRFVVWLEVLMESGAEAAAQKIAGLDAELVTAALAQHVRVFDGASVSPYTTLDGEQVEPLRASSGGAECEIGGFLVEAIRTESWDAMASVLLALEAEQPDFFHQVMSGCRSLSSSRPEADGLDDLLSAREQDMFDLAIERDQRREKQGYVSPAEARAFLQQSRQRQSGHETARTIEPPMEIVLETGLATRPARARLQTLMDVVRNNDAAAYSTRIGEFAYLANAIMAGCSIQARPFTTQEASDAAAAVCDLGLENWTQHQHPTQPLPEAFLAHHDLLSVFQVGWAVLHDDVCMYAAGRLAGILSGMTCDDHEIQSGLDALRASLERHWRAGTPWHAREDLDVIATLDMPAWAALLGLIDQCPVIHAGLGASRRSGTLAVSASAFEFISDNSQIASIHQFLESLPGILRS